MSKDSIITISGKLGSNSQLSSQSSENHQLAPIQKLLFKAVVMPIADIIKLGSICTLYKIEIEVCHTGKSCNFVFCNRECKLLLGLSSAQLRHTMIQDGIHDPLEFSLALDQMLDLEITFKVKWQPRWKNCSVVMILKNDPFIKQLGDQLETIENFDITSKHNSGPITPPGKRQFLDASSESTSSEGFCDGELSSNKLKNIIKVEKND
ncbi:unnamed protein product [Vicia faba]|uniref:Uncharacterized protein n=1 Tax=Vicia faba TaxID=3906 RepID=A0AAV1AL57_VICFA|nr:unnamed protein product [Vicia faba]